MQLNRGLVFDPLLRSSLDAMVPSSDIAAPIFLNGPLR